MLTATRMPMPWIASRCSVHLLRVEFLGGPRPWTLIEECSGDVIARSVSMRAGLLRLRAVCADMARLGDPC